MKFIKYLLIAVFFLLITGCGGGSSTSTKSLSAATTAQLDTLINNFMTAHIITAGSITVMSGTTVLYNKSYGYQDQNSTTSIVSDPLMVTASIVKPLTAATVQYLAGIGTLNLSDHVFCTGANTPCWLNVVDPAGVRVSGFAAGGFVDTRYANITIQQLLDHEGGWDRGLKTCANEVAYDTLTTPCDPMVQERLIQSTLHTAFPANFTSSQLPSQMNDIYYWVTRNALDHAPGTTQVYSNFGYMILTAIVAKVTNSDYNTYVYNTLLSPLAVSTADFSAFSFSPTAGSAQSTRTPYLLTTTYCPSIDSSNLGASVLGTALGCLNPLNWVGAATTLTTSKVMAQVAATYKIDNTNDLKSTTNPSMDGPNTGKSLSGTTNSGVHYGDLPGVTNILRQLLTGTSYALMLNKDNTLDAWQATLYPQIDAIIAAGGY